MKDFTRKDLCILLLTLIPTTVLITSIAVTAHRLYNTVPGVNDCVIEFVKEKPRWLFSWVGNMYVRPDWEAHIEYNTWNLERLSQYKIWESQWCWMWRDVISTVHCTTAYFLYSK